ncbi:MAG: MraY family glycosyltransferase [Sphingomonadaceae bacterium]
MLAAIAMMAPGALIALMIGHHALAIGTRLRLLDYPDVDGGRKLHATVTPLVGGLAVVAALLPPVLLLWAQPSSLAQDQMISWFIITVVGLYVIGIADDRFGLTAPFRLGMAIALLVLAIGAVPRFNLHFLLFSGQTELILLPGLVGVGFTLLCLVGFLNAVNMADGKNGLVIGQALIWSVILMVRLPQWLLPIVAAVSGALAVLFFYNMKGRLFLGDGGSYALSAIFGLLAVVGWNAGFADFRADDVALIFAVPVFDTLRLMVQRMLHRKSPFTAGRDHLHHYLYERWGWPRPLTWVLALVALPNAGAILLPGTAHWWLLVTFIGYVALIGAAIYKPKVSAG